jgi:hypothetical protein
MNFIDQITAKLFSNKSSKKTEYYFAVSIGLSEVTASVWGLEGEKIDILGQSSKGYLGTEDLVEKTHEVLDSSLGALDIEPDKVLFGVPDLWSQDDNLKEPYLKLLNKMLKAYDLSPLAYVTTTNALSYLIQKHEGAPATAILLGVGDFVEITLVKGGKIIGSKSTKRSDSLFEDIESILSEFTEVEVLPSKIMLYMIKSGEKLNKIHDDLMSYPWMQKLSFLHFPKIEILADDMTSQAIIFAGASELYPDKELKKNFSLYQEITPMAQSNGLSGLHSIKRDLEKDEIYEDSRDLEKEDLGIVKGDIKEALEKEDEIEESLPKGKTRKLKKFNSLEEDDLEGDNLISPEDDDLSSFEEIPEKHLTIFKNLPPFLTQFNLPFKRSLKRLKFWKILIIPVVLAVLLVAYVVFFKVSITLLVEPRNWDKDAIIVVDPKASKVDEVNKIIPGKVVETTVTGSDKALATGTKQIGDPAKGKVIIRNKTDSAVSISNGITLTSSSGLKFILDQTVQIASASSTTTPEGTNITWGKTEPPVGITAVVIGPESNLTGGTEMSVGNYSKDQVIANVDTALSGGTSKEVTVVTGDDQKKLQANVTEMLKQKAVDDLKNQSKDGKKIITDALTIVDGKYTFSKQAGDQASEFNLNATIKFKGTSYQDSDLKMIVSKLVEVNIPPNYGMNLQDAETQAEVAKTENDGRLIFSAKFRAKLIPKYNIEDLKKQIKGKSTDEAITALKSQENVLAAEINFIPNLFGPLNRIPYLEKNIEIIITPK